MLFSNGIRKSFLLGASCMVSMTALGQAAFTPGSVNATIGIGQSVTVHSSLKLDTTGATTVDVFFLADNTGSMGSTVAKAQAGASAILGALPSSYQYGVGAYFGDPSESGMTPATSYRQLTALTGNKTAVQNGINSWVATGGGDIPEANYFALAQASNTAAWRTEAKRVVVWFGDAPSHTETTTQSQAIAALQAANADVVAFNNTGAGGGIDGRYATEPTTTRQASDIVAAVGGNLTNSFLSISNQGFVDAVVRAIGSVTSTVDLNFGSTLTTKGLKLAFTCTDIQGCNDVPGGASRTFDTTITGVSAGTYAFDAFAQGVDAFQHYTVTVAVPEPAVSEMMLAGLAVVAGIAGWRRRSRVGK